MRVRRAAILSLLFCALFGLLDARLFAQSPSKAGNDGFSSLFDGESLRGWRAEGGAPDRVRAGQGVLRLTEGAGWLRTERTQFRTFALRFDVRATAADTLAVLGFLGRSPTSRAMGGAYVLPFLGEALPDSKVWWSVKPKLFRLNRDGVARAARPIGEWQTLQIMRREVVISVSLNGDVILTDEGPRTPDGWIGFLTQRGSVELRNIQLRPLPPEPPQGVFLVGDGVTVPRVLREQRPNYTAQALKAGIEGTVLVECVIEPDGSVSKAFVIRSVDDQFGLDDEALRAARLWRFAPATRLGQPVAVVVTIEVTFRLKY